MEYLDRWMELSETSLSYEGIRDLLVPEQTLGVGSAELRVFIEKRIPVLRIEFTLKSSVYWPIIGLGTRT